MDFTQRVQPCFIEGRVELMLLGNALNNKAEDREVTGSSTGIQ